ncbi:DUF87 domain-containing protein [Candidatus Bathyarchaeota archaeon]|nr:DUF87 domain-containing protein [Candidatus Bathyarchaeota archaeon]
MELGLVVGGEVSSIEIREKAGVKLELGELLIVEDGENKLLLQVYDLRTGSQIATDSREFLAGMGLEGAKIDTEYLHGKEYTIAFARSIAEIDPDGNLSTPKVLPPSFAPVRSVNVEDLRFLTKPDNPLFLGNVRSGSKTLDVEVYLDAKTVLPYHILIPAMTGRGKSNLVKIILWSILDQSPNDYGTLVLDPHDEYYGRHNVGLKDHPRADERLVYYSPSPKDEHELVINLESIVPEHIEGIVYLSEKQTDIVNQYYNHYGESWVEKIIEGTELEGLERGQITTIKRKFENFLGIYMGPKGKIHCHSQVFSQERGDHTIADLISYLKSGKMVILDTIRLTDEAELLIGSIIAHSLYDEYLCAKAEGKISSLPIITIVLEEAPRTLSNQTLDQKGRNIYSLIAREGRKFKMGLLAITQLTSIIPKSILTNMSTKIILGNEMESERVTIIESSSQDLSTEEHTISSLDLGEAIVTSIFTKFAVPIKIPYFDDYVKKIRDTL